ncbi:MAG: hypothetical protein JXA11_09120 [Phycisphaerae bacterium]|nr:hypothetical protein [Phycisphaerae bacterium]
MKFTSNTWSGALIVGILFSLLPGCVSVSAPKKIEFGAGGSDHDKKPLKDDPTERQRRISKSEAYSIARDEAINAGAQPRIYDIHDKKLRKSYWVLFEAKDPAKKRTWKNHFAVRVSVYGWSRLYKPSPRKSGYKTEKIKKKKAVDIAKRLAKGEGADLKKYDIHDKEINDNYWVIFDTKSYKKKAGWKNHFAVRVGKRGLADVYK